MSKLYFRYGTVKSAKTLNLLSIAMTYKKQGKKVLLLKPSIDTRFGGEIIKSAIGLSDIANILIDDDTDLTIEFLQDYTKEEENKKIDLVLVDEAQFLHPKHIEQLRLISFQSIPVICYGLRNDFMNHLFEGSKRLMELADEIEEIKTTCFFCSKKASCNLKHYNGEVDLSGPIIQIGSDEKYFPSCYECYYSFIFSDGLVKKKEKEVKIDV